MEESYLVGDIGGTNTRLRVVFNNKFLDFNFETKKLENLDVAINEVLEKVNLKIEKACFGVAGPVENGSYCKPTFIDWVVDKKTILNNTSLSNVFLLNDFEALGWGINALGEKDYVRLNNVEVTKNGNKCLIGAGTGLGVAILHYNKDKNFYAPLASEAGHMFFPAVDGEEELINYIKQKENPVIYTSLLTGKGLENIYKALGGEELTAENIVKKNNSFSEDACRIFSEVYGRFAANMALTSLPIGGLYIAGGIAIKNPWLIDSEYFKKAFVNVSPRMERAINKIPLFLINDENFGLNGALFYLKLK